MSRAAITVARTRQRNSARWRCAAQLVEFRALVIRLFLFLLALRRLPRLHAVQFGTDA